MVNTLLVKLKIHDLFPSSTLYQVVCVVESQQSGISRCCTVLLLNGSLFVYLNVHISFINQFARLDILTTLEFTDSVL